MFFYEHLDPLFHNFKGTDDNDIDESNQELWWTYCTINKKFVENLAEV